MSILVLIQQKEEYAHIQAAVGNSLPMHVCYLGNDWLDAPALVTLAAVDLAANKYVGLIVPNGTTICSQFPAILEYFMRFRRPVCLIGTGTALLATTHAYPWILKGYSVTSPPHPAQDSVEHFVYDHYGKHSLGSTPDGIHVVVGLIN